MIERADAINTYSISPLKLAMLTLGWGAACALLLLVALFQSERFDTFHRVSLLIVFGTGGAAGWIIASLLFSVIRTRIRNGLAQFLLACLLLAGATLFVTSGLFALHYRSFYAQWHAEAFTRDWILQFIFTSASAAYQFLIVGTRLFGVASMPVLLAGSAILARSMR